MTSKDMWTSYGVTNTKTVTSNAMHTKKSLDKNSYDGHKYHAANRSVSSSTRETTSNFEVMSSKHKAKLNSTQNTLLHINQFKFGFSKICRHHVIKGRVERIFSLHHSNCLYLMNTKWYLSQPKSAANWIKKYNFDTCLSTTVPS